MKAMSRPLRLSRLALAALLPIVGCEQTVYEIGSRAPATAEIAQNLNIGFNGADTTGSDDQLPYIDRFFTATEAYYQALGRWMPGNRHCHAYVSWDVAEESDAANANVQGSLAWFQEWLQNYEDHCDEALITFKYISGVSSGTGAPSAADFEKAFLAFLQTSWKWTGRFAFTPWNEPNNPAASGDGLCVSSGSCIVLPAATAADYYLILRKYCTPFNNCSVAAGDFGSNGNLGKDFVQNCTDDAAPVCSNATYMDAYKHYLVADAPTYGFPSSFRPEIFAYHAWDDINDYINNNANCNSVTDKTCTTWVLLNSLSETTWTNVKIWDTEVGAGQNPQTNPNVVDQACAASFLLNLTATVSSRIYRIYYTRAWEPDGEHWSLFDSTGAEKPAFAVLANRNTSYSPPSGDSCP